MLIPFLDTDPSVAAALVPNGHVIKLAVEAFQILRACTTSESSGGWTRHPCVRWARHSAWAWDWVFAFARCLATREYCARYQKSEPHGVWARIEQLERPHEFAVYTEQETPPCPLPAAAAGSGQEDRVLAFRRYYAEHKNKPMWQFLWEPRARRPEWMPKRTREQDEIVMRIAKRMK